ncbi:MAG: SGNH/GDSL hydrolase family protein, partial [Geodermatophilaceae bacterium]|nr:SGNH/GDSL hydrolase family protein [Geodermatophilaceae bacterium]
MLRLAVLGDSIAFGTGASHDRDTLGPGLVARLAAAGVASEARVFAVPGARSVDLTGQVERCAGWAPNIVVIVIGANDVTHFVPADVAAESLRVAVRALRAVRAEVVLAPAPDLSAVPHVPPT